MIFKKLLDGVNQYLSLIIIIPALLGGLWQIIELSSISFSYIRFFSVTQIIPDGLLILFFLILFASSSIFLFWFAEKSRVNNHLTEEDSNLENRRNVFHAFIFFLFLVLCCLGIFFFNYYIIENLENFFCILIFIPVNILLFALANQAIEMTLNSLLNIIPTGTSSKMLENFLFFLKYSYFIIFFICD